MSTNIKIFIAAALLVGLGLAIFVSPFASSSPDGLEKVAETEGFDGAAQDHDMGDGPLADYGVKGVDDEKLGTGVAGLIGTLVTFGIGLGLFGLVRVARDRSTPSASSAAMT